LYREQWQSLADRIKGLTRAGELGSRGPNNASALNSYFVFNAREIFTAIRAYGDQFSTALPPAAREAVRDLFTKHAYLFQETLGSSSHTQQQIWSFLVLLAAFESQMSFHLSDNQEAIRTRSERAFVHLQRLIVADEELRIKWQRAFHCGELACESLGATHLLLHGIFAFKAHGIGERTDLVLNEPIGDISPIQRFADGLVLTEWNVAKEDRPVPAKFDEARAGAQLYSAVVLAGLELAGYRYAIVVSNGRVDPPGDFQQAQYTIRHINLAVAPQTPSVASRKRRPAGKQGFVDRDTDRTPSLRGAKATRQSRSARRKLAVWPRIATPPRAARNDDEMCRDQENPA